MKLKPVSISKIRHYLTVNGFQKEATKGDIEEWINHRGNKRVLICVSESEMPVIAILTMIKEIEDEVDAFLRIISVIK